MSAGFREKDLFSQIYRSGPLVHVINNVVTVNDVVNVILAAGGKAICATEPSEMEEVENIADALLLNTGTPDDRRLEAMLTAGKAANRRKIPVVLDPAGIGVSKYRMHFLARLLEHVQVACIRGNMSEMAALYGIHFRSCGVEDAGVVLTQDQLMELARRLHCVLAVTGEKDYAVSPDKVLENESGSPLQKRITGSGCMLSGLTAAALGSISCTDALEERMEIVRNVLHAYGKAAEKAADHIRRQQDAGTMTFRLRLIDEISRLGGSGEAAGGKRSEYVEDEI